MWILIAICAIPFILICWRSMFNPKFYRKKHTNVLPFRKKDERKKTK